VILRNAEDSTVVTYASDNGTVSGCAGLRGNGLPTYVRNQLSFRKGQDEEIICVDRGQCQLAGFRVKEVRAKKFRSFRGFNVSLAEEKNVAVGSEHAPGSEPLTTLKPLQPLQPLKP
jgi:hypothetical protein